MEIQPLGWGIWPQDPDPAETGWGFGPGMGDADPRVWIQSWDEGSSLRLQIWPQDGDLALRWVIQPRHEGSSPRIQIQLWEGDPSPRMGIWPQDGGFSRGGTGIWLQDEAPDPRIGLSCPRSRAEAAPRARPRPQNTFFPLPENVSPRGTRSRQATLFAMAKQLQIHVSDHKIATGLLLLSQNRCKFSFDSQTAANPQVTAPKLV